MKKKMLALFCFCFLFLNIVDLVVPRSEAEIFDNVIRLHVLADDNSDEAQNIKLLVRDAVLSQCGDLFSESGNVIAASENVESNLSKIESVANKVLAENGVDYKASAQWGYEEYPTRYYENITLPSGTYRSLRINLGKAEGNNWWCVLFPPLCNSAASDKSLASANVSESDSEVFSNSKYIFRFKLLELFGD